MGWIELMLIVAGISLDIFAAMECQGSLVQKVDKKQLSLICLIVAAWQLIALFIGHFLSGLLYRESDATDEFFIGCILAVVIFFCLGVRLLVKAVKNEKVFERRNDKLELKRFIWMVGGTSFYTFMAGAAMGLLHMDFLLILIFIIVFSVVFVIAGMYTGYHFGFEHKTKAYMIGTALLWIAGIDVVVRMLNHAI